MTDDHSFEQLAQRPLTSASDVAEMPRNQQDILPFDMPVLESFKDDLFNRLLNQGVNPDDVFQVIGMITDMHENNQVSIVNPYPTVIAGGAVRSYFDQSEVADIDMFVSNYEMIQKISDEAGQHYRVVWKCPQDEVITIVPIREPNLKIQVMPLLDDPDNGTYSSMDSWKGVIKRFDIGACCAAVTIRSNQQVGASPSFWVTAGGALRRFFTDVSKRQITLNVVEYPVATIRRITKYVTKGYTLTNSALFDLTNAVYQFTDQMPDTYEVFLALDTDSPFTRYPLD